MTVAMDSQSQVLVDNFYGNFQVNADGFTGLTFAWQAGQITGSSSTTIAAGTIAMADDDVNYVYVESGAVATDVTIPATDVRLLWEVTTASGVITAVADLRDVLSIGN